VSATAVSERLLQWLREAGVAFEVLEHAPVRTSEEAARVRGTRLEQGAKALVVRADDRVLHCVLPAHLRADNAALRRGTYLYGGRCVKESLAELFGLTFEPLPFVWR